MTGSRSLQLTKAIRHAIREAKLSYEFVPNSYTMGALNAVLAVEQVYLRETTDMPLAHDGGDQQDTTAANGARE